MAGIKPNNKSSPGPIGNTQGLIIPKTSPNASGPGNSAPKPEEQPKEKGWWKSWGSNLTHNVLDVVGLIPVVGEVCDGANALVYAAEGDMVNAALSTAAMLPVGGQAATAGKWAVKGIKKIEKEVVKEVEEAAAKKLAKEAEEIAAKKAAKEAEEKAAKGGHVEGPKEPLSTKDPRYKRGKFRKGVREKVWEDAKGPDGKVRNPVTGKEMEYNEPWDMGHKPGYEHRKHQQSASARNISRKEFLNEYNDPAKYRPELPSSNRSHAGENKTSDYFGD